MKTLFFSDGSVYHGDTLFGVPHGYGKLHYLGGGSFTGNFLFGKMRKGERLYNNQDVYVGTFKNNRKHGRGEYYWGLGDYYIGQWVDDKCANDNKTILGRAPHVEPNQEPQRTAYIVTKETYNKMFKNLENASSDPAQKMDASKMLDNQLRHDFERGVSFVDTARYHRICAEADKRKQEREEERE